MKIFMKITYKDGTDQNEEIEVKNPSLDDFRIEMSRKMSLEVKYLNIPDLSEQKPRYLWFAIENIRNMEFSVP